MLVDFAVRKMFRVSITWTLREAEDARVKRHADRQNKATLEGAFVAMGKRKPVKWQGSRVVVCRDVQGS